MNRLLGKLVLISACVLAQSALHAAEPPSAPFAPVADHHQHLFSPAAAELVAGPGNPGITAKDVVALLDTAGIQRGVVLSVAYIYGSPKRKIEDEYARVRAENDWTAAQAALYPDRLIAFCSFNPLKAYALEELKRCAGHPGLRHGIKLHFGNADLQLEVPEHAERMRQVFRAANANRMAIAVHMRASISLNRPYGAAQARLFLDQLMPLATDIPVQIAHMAGTGPGYDDPPADAAMAVFAEAAERRDPRMRQVWFDVASVAAPDITRAQAELLVKRIRQVGVDRILYGSDAAVGDTPRPREGWAAFRMLPLTESELAQIAGNVAPYLRVSKQ